MTKIYDSIRQRTQGRITMSLTRIIALLAVVSLFLAPQPVYAADNLAQIHGTATASPNNASAQYAIDGTVNTFWGSDPAQSSWLLVDLGAIYYIDGFEVDFTAQSASPDNVIVSIGIDGQHFNSYDEKNSPQQTWVSPVGFDPDTSPQTDTFVVRYVKIEFTSDGGDQDVQVEEFKVWGHASNVTIPAVTTGAVSSIGATTATGNGNITTLGSLTLIDYGICWKTGVNPDCDDDHVISGGVPQTTGPFTVPMAGLTAETTYYVKAYVTDGFSYFYGDEVHFTTGSTVSTVLTTTANPSVYGQSVTFTAAVTASDQGADTPTGTVTFSDGQTELDTVNLTEGSATYTTSSLSIATHSIKAVYSGDNNYPANTSNTISQVVNKSGTTTTLTSSANPVARGKSVSFSATVTAAGQGAGTPTGTVTFSDGQTFLGTVDLTQGVATYATSQLTAGNHTIYAAYNADAHFSASTTNIVQKIKTSGSSGGGGGGGGSANPSPSPTYSTSITLSVSSTVDANTPTGTSTTSAGNIKISGTQSDANIKITVAPGTTAVDSNGKSVTNITVSALAPASLPLSQFALPEGAVVLAYDFGPGGTTFSAPITVKCNYDPAALPSGADQSKIQVAVYSPGAGKVTLMPCTVDTINHTVTFSTDHFSYYMLIAPDEAKPIVSQSDTSEPAVDAVNSPTATPSAAPQVASEDAAAVNNGPVATASAPQPDMAPFNPTLLIVIIVAVLVALCCLLFIRKKNNNAKGV